MKDTRNGEVLLLRSAVLLQKAEKERAWNCEPSGRRILYVSYDYE